MPRGTRSAANPKGVSVGLVITDAGFYLGIAEGVYHSQDNGTSWISLKDGLDAEIGFMHSLPLKTPYLLAPIAGYIVLVLGHGEKVPIRPEGVSTEKPTIYALVVAGHRLYAAAGDAFTNSVEMRSKLGMSNNGWWSLYRSTDSGDSWYSIDPWERLENETKKKRKRGFPVGFGLDIRNEDGTVL